MQYLRNQWSDFKNSWSCLILTLLWIQLYTMHPLHLNYTTTVPCEAIIMKILVFIIVRVLKTKTWKFDILDCHSSKPCTKGLFQNVFKVSAPCFHTSSKSFDKAQYGLLFGLSVQLTAFARWHSWWSSVADHPILFAKLSSARRWYLARVEMSCSVQA